MHMLKLSKIFCDTDLEDVLLDPAFWAGLFIAFIIVCSVGLLFAFIIRRSREIEDSSHPLRSARAKVLEKQQFPSNATIYATTLGWFLFELESGERLRLRAKALCGLVVGDTGTLTWQGERVRNFEWDEKKANDENF